MQQIVLMKSMLENALEEHQQATQVPYTDTETESESMNYHVLAIKSLILSELRQKREGE